jgi:hypothetical protein
MTSTDRPMIVLPDAPTDSSGWARLDDQMFEALLLEALVDLGWQILQDKDVEIRMLGAKNWPAIALAVRNRWRGQFELAKREASGVRPS